jgi:hypothetical protein
MRTTFGNSGTLVPTHVSQGELPLSAHPDGYMSSATVTEAATEIMTRMTLRTPSVSQDSYVPIWARYVAVVRYGVNQR